jgi:hypothetical protein
MLEMKAADSLFTTTSPRTKDAAIERRQGIVVNLQIDFSPLKKTVLTLRAVMLSSVVLSGPSWADQHNTTQLEVDFGI